MKTKGLARKVLDSMKRHPRRAIIVALSLSIAVFVAISLAKIGAWSVWFDESFSVFMVKQNFSDIWYYTAVDVNAPLYYYLLKIWSLFVGYGDVALRSFSVIWGVGAIVAGFFLARRMFGKKASYIMLPFITLSPMLLRYATEMRSYTFLIFLLLVSTYVFVKANEKPSRKAWLIYGVLISLALWTHYYAALVIIAQLGYRALTLYRSSAMSKMSGFKNRFKSLWKAFFERSFTHGLLLAAVLFLPWLPMMVVQFLNLQAGFWIGPFGVDALSNFFGEMVLYEEHGKAVSYMAAGLIALITLLIILLIKIWKSSSRKYQNNLLLVLLVVVVPPVLLIIASMPPLHPMFINRYVIFSMVAFSLLLAIASSATLKARALKITQTAFFVLALVLSIVGAKQVLYYGTYNFDTGTVSMAKQLMEKIASQTSEKTIVITDGPWMFYDVNVYATEKNPTYFLDSSTKYEYGSLAMLKDDNADKIIDIESLDHNQTVWYVSASEDGSLTPPVASWQKIQSFSIANPIDGKRNTNATRYLVQ